MLQKSLKVLRCTKHNFFTNVVNLNNKVGEVLEKWKERFTRENVAEPVESIVNILAFNLGTKNVSDLYKNLILLVVYSL